MWLGYTTTWEDASLPHQIVIRSHGQNGAVSCNCLRTVTGWTPIEVRSAWTIPEALRVYREYHERLAVSAAQPDEGDDEGCTTATGASGMPGSGTAWTARAL